MHHYAQAIFHNETPHLYPNFPFFHISVIIVSPGYTGEENRQSNLFSRFTSFSHILSIIERHAIPYVHIPCKIGFSNPAAFAKLGSECNGL